MQLCVSYEVGEEKDKREEKYVTGMQGLACKWWASQFRLVGQRTKIFDKDDAFFPLHTLVL